MQVLYVNSDKDALKKAWSGEGESIFLAGPTPRADDVPSWRPEAVEILKSKGFAGDVFIPEDKSAERYSDYDGQINWEWNGLDAATVQVYWVPRDLQTMPAFTTNVEFGLYAASGKCVLGYPKGAPKMRYLHALAEKYNMPIAHTLEETLQHALDVMKVIKREVA